MPNAFVGGQNTNVADELHFHLPSNHGAASSQQEDEEDDYLDHILDNYQFICHPEVRVKLKQQIKNYSICTSVAKPWPLINSANQPWYHGSRIRITLKPDDQTALAGLLHKLLLVPSRSQVCAFSKKLQLGWLRLQFMAGYNWKRKRPTLDYRVTTKWSEGGRLKRKERYQVTDSVLLRCNWKMDLRLPDMEGHLGTDEQDWGPVDVDYGEMRFEISQVDVVLQSPLWRPRPSALPTHTSHSGHAARSRPTVSDDGAQDCEHRGGGACAAGPGADAVEDWQGVVEAQRPRESGPRAWWRRLVSSQGRSCPGGKVDGSHMRGGSEADTIGCPIDAVPAPSGRRPPAQQQKQQQQQAGGEGRRQQESGSRNGGALGRRAGEGGDNSSGSSSSCSSVAPGPSQSVTSQQGGLLFADWLAKMGGAARAQ